MNEQKLNPPIIESDAEIFPIFPTPVFIKKNAVDLVDTAPLINVLDFDKNDSGDHHGKISRSNYILDDIAFDSLKNKLTDYVQEFCNSVLGLSGPYQITQSWISVKEKGEFHSTHCHGNSIISGVLYFNNFGSFPGLTFVKTSYSNMFSMFPLRDDTTNNIYTSEAVSFDIENQMLILFPSYVSHAVNVNTDKNPRYVLAFNTMPAYQLGDGQSLTEFKYGK